MSSADEFSSAASIGEPRANVSVDSSLQANEDENSDKARLVFETNTKSVYRTQTYDNMLHPDDLTKPFFLTFFLAAWAFIIYLFLTDGWKSGVIAMSIVFFLNLLGLWFKHKNPFLKATRWAEKKFKAY